MRIPSTSKGATQRQRGFTLLELLIVIGIIGVLASMGLPAIKGLSNSNSVAAGGRQLMDDIAAARQRAINERTTVYMVFVPPQIVDFKANLSQFTADEVKQMERLLNGTYTTYNFYTSRTLGDQPGPGRPRYISEWRSLPEGVFFSTNLFIKTTANQWKNWPMADLTNRPLPMVTVPFPSANSKFRAELPCLAFNYQGQLMNPAPGDFYMRITKGSIVYARDDKGQYKFEYPEVIETPKGNSAINPVIRIDWLTGRAKSMQPAAL